jgi:hypothetical protein
MGSEFDFKYSFHVSSRVLYLYKSINTDAARCIAGIHILEICFDGIHVPASPLLFDVKGAICVDEDMLADSVDGVCWCDSHQASDSFKVRTVPKDGFI